MINKSSFVEGVLNGAA